MLVFASNVKNAKAFFLVDDLTVVAILGGLCALGGVVLTTTSFKDNASEVLTNAVNSYVDYYGGLATDAYEKVKELATDIYASGCVLASDFNDWIHGWLGDFVNTYVLQNYSTEGTVSAPIFSGVDNFTFNTDLLVYGNDGTVSQNLHDLWLYKNIIFYSPVLVNGRALFDYPNTPGDIEWIKIAIGAEGLSLYKMFSGQNVWSPSRWTTNPSQYYLPLSVPLAFTGIVNYCVEFADGTQAYFNHETNKWSRDMEGTLELDPGVFNPDILGDIDIAPPYTDGLLDNTLDYTNYWVLGGDMTFDSTGDMTYPGTLTVPKDLPYDVPWDNVYDPDYPYVISPPTDIPVDIPTDIPKDIVVDKYPDIPITTTPTYTADWTSVFPFCIPFDIFRFFELLSAKPEAPNFTWEYDILGVKGSLDIDLSTFDEIAQICRNMMDLIFIVGLAMATRAHLIKA